MLNRLPPVAAQGLSQSVMVDLRMELLAPYAELRPERDPPRVRSPLCGQPPLVCRLHAWLCWQRSTCRVQKPSAVCLKYCVLPPRAQEEDIFWMLMSGDRDALRVGRMVEARVRGVSVRCPCCVVYMRGTLYRVYARHSCRLN